MNLTSSPCKFKIIVEIYQAIIMQNIALFWLWTDFSLDQIR